LPERLWRSFGGSKHKSTALHDHVHNGDRHRNQKQSSAGRAAIAWLQIASDPLLRRSAKDGSSIGHTVTICWLIGALDADTEGSVAGNVSQMDWWRRIVAGVAFCGNDAIGGEISRRDIV
jgi:hypothetical protein